MNKRKFPVPWRCRQTPGGYVIEDATGLPLLYCYAKTEREAGTGYYHLSWEEAERIAAFVTSFPERYKEEERTK